MTVSPKRASMCPWRSSIRTLTVLTHGARHSHRLADDDRVRRRDRHDGPTAGIEDSRTHEEDQDAEHPINHS